MTFEEIKNKVSLSMARLSNLLGLEVNDQAWKHVVLNEIKLLRKRLKKLRKIVKR